MVYLLVAFKLKDISLEQQMIRSREHVSNVAGSPGLHWKLWLGDDNTGEYAGFYEFETRQDAEAYMQPGGGGSGLFGLNKSPIIARKVSYQIYDCFRYQKEKSAGFWQLEEFQNLPPEGGSFEPDRTKEGIVYLLDIFKLKDISLEQQMIRSREKTSNVAGSPGLHWKLWLGDDSTGEYAGFYGFDTREEADAYMQPGAGGSGVFELEKLPIIARKVSYQIYDCFRYQKKEPTGFWQLDEYQSLPEGGSFEPDWILAE